MHPTQLADGSAAVIGEGNLFRSQRNERSRARKALVRRNQHTDTDRVAFRFYPAEDYSLRCHVVIGSIDDLCTYYGTLKFNGETKEICCSAGKKITKTWSTTWAVKNSPVWINLKIEAIPLKKQQIHFLIPDVAVRCRYYNWTDHAKYSRWEDNFTIEQALCSLFRKASTNFFKFISSEMIEMKWIYDACSLLPPKDPLFPNYQIFFMRWTV